MARKRQKQQNPHWRAGIGAIYDDRLFRRINWIYIYDAADDTRIPPGNWAAVNAGGNIYCNTRIQGSEDEWAYAIAHSILHLCFGHFQRHRDQRAWNYACDIHVARFLEGIRFGRPPEAYRVDYPAFGGDEEAAYQELTLRSSLPGDYVPDLLDEPVDYYGPPRDYPGLFTRGLRDAVTEAVRIAGGIPETDAWEDAAAGSVSEQARSWFMRSYPLLGALATGFRLIEDLDACRRLDIQIAAVSASRKEIYVNPTANLSPGEMRFVMAHEILHAALRHDERQEKRDAYLWNVSCDYAINQWLVEMEVGKMPAGLLDPELKGLSAEAIYDRITSDLRLQRRLRRSATFAGTGKPDILDKSNGWWQRGEGITLDEFYRSALAQGLDLHEETGRGLLPAGLVEEIRAQAMPPIPWEVKLAQWLDQYFPTPEYRRSYARPSRRQNATPEIPRPRVVPLEGWDDARTFGVVIDTSGSMSEITLARGLGAIASYCTSREIPAVRVCFCDAAAYDAGYMTADEVAGRVRVKGGGGTVLQPGIDLLQKADDFPDVGPILVVTDTYCEPNLHLGRPHAFLVPYGQRLPFPPKGPVFTMAPDKSERR